MSNKSAVEHAQHMGRTLVVPEGKRLGGPGTRSKNPARYDRIGKERKANA